MSHVTGMAPDWAEPTDEEIGAAVLFVLMSHACPCWLWDDLDQTMGKPLDPRPLADAWGIVNDYPHTSAECGCVCHEVAA